MTHITQHFYTIFRTHYNSVSLIVRLVSSNAIVWKTCKGMLKHTCTLYIMKMQITFNDNMDIDPNYFNILTFRIVTIFWFW